METNPTATCFSKPWVLVTTGGQVSGQRPRTRLAFLVSTYPVWGNTPAAGGKGFYVHPRTFKQTTGLVRIPWEKQAYSWRRRPSVQQLRKARAELPVLP